MRAVEIDGRGVMEAAMAHVVAGHPRCGVLHGHTVSLSMRIEADKLDSMGFVIDFTKVKPAMKGALAILDHQGLVVAGAMCEAVDTEGRILVHNEDEVYDLPGDEVVMLPIPAATAEALAAWAGTQIWKQIPDEDLERITYAEVTFWETPNTGATFVIRERRAEY